jgi:ribosomal protein S6
MIGEGEVKAQIERVKAVVQRGVIDDLKQWGCL